MKILLPTPLRQYSNKQPSVDLPASTVGEALSGLVSRHPDLRRHLYNEDGKLRAFVNVYLNDEDVRYLDREATPVSDSDTISIVPSIAGGIDEFTDFKTDGLTCFPPMGCCPTCFSVSSQF